MTLNVATNIELKILAGCTRIHKGLSNPSMEKRKNNSDSFSPSKQRLTKKTTKRIKCTVGSPNDVAEQDNVVEQKVLIPVCMKGVTPVKRHVEKRQVPPSPFDLNLIPRSKSITVIERKYACFVEEEHRVLNRYVCVTNNFRCPYIVVFVLILSKCSILLLHVDRVWFQHEDPWPLSLTGRELWDAFAKPGTLHSDTFDAIVRLLQEEDILMYKDGCCDHQQWRHLLPPCFLVSACSETIDTVMQDPMNKVFSYLKIDNDDQDFVTANGEGIYSEQVRDLFLGPHLGSNAEHCRLVHGGIGALMYRTKLSLLMNSFCR